MMGTFDHRKIERKWQKKWKDWDLYHAQDFDKSPKRYVLIEFPYTSGERLHVGHGRSYCCLDAVARLQRMRGYNVLFPIGWDAFGLPAENYALKTGIHPSITTKENIANAKKQAQSWGLSFDWEREINTTDPDYYRWTQWIFLQFFKKGLAYKAEVPVNWCPSCKINLADEEVVASECERCGTPVTRRLQSQWMLKITAYADHLIDDLAKVDYRADIKAQQINWIGRSEGTVIRFPIQRSIQGYKDTKIQGEKARYIGVSSEAVSPYIEIFTTRPDTLFGATFLVLSPEKAEEYFDLIPSKERVAVEEYIKQSLRKSELQRQEGAKSKTGVFTGFYAQHPLRRNLPAGRQKLPVWVADFVLSGYGTGAVMAVPAHDQRDFEFAKKYGLPVQEVIENEAESKLPDEPFEGEGRLINSSQFDGLQFKEAGDRITRFLIAKKLGQKSTDYKLRDWVFSRQHYWGEPIPIIYCRRCWEDQKSNIKNQKLGYDFVKINGKQHAIVTVSEENLPVHLPYVENYKPTETGASPLAAVRKWVNVRCPICNSQAIRETDTMPNWAGSSWYYLAYAFWHKLGGQKVKIFAKGGSASGGKKQEFENAFLKYRKELDYWMGPSRDAGRASRSFSGGGVDWYNGGMEHTTLHLLYSRFWHKFLYDLKLVPGVEPYAKRTSHGVVLGPDGSKMSKSRGNVINPDEVVAEFGADTFRMYEAFMGPFEQMITWDPKGVLGVRRFLDKVWKAHQVVSSQESVVSGQETKRALHKLIKKVEEDTMALKFNTAVAEMMKFVNQLASSNWQLETGNWKLFLRVLAPYAPHLTEELYQSFQTIENSKFGSIHQQPWPKYDPKLIVEETVTVIVQVNGKMRGKLELPAGTEEVEVVKLARELEAVRRYIEGETTASGGVPPKAGVAKTVFVPDNLINFVTQDAI